MKKNNVKIGLLQMSMSYNKEENLDKTIKKIKEAVLRGAEIVCLPELFNAQYFPQNENEENFKLAEEIPNKTTEALSKSAKENKVTLIGGSLFEKGNDGKFYNTSLIFNNYGKIIGKYRKIHIPYEPCFYEKKYFAPGSEYSVIDTGKIRIGVLICYDQWFPEAARINALKGAQIIFYPTAIGWANDMKKIEPFSAERWVRDQCSHASMNGIFVASVNRVGKENDMEFWGNSFVADPFGNVIARAGSTKEEILITELDLALIKASQDGWGFLRNRRPETYGEVIKSYTLNKPNITHQE